MNAFARLCVLALLMACEATVEEGLSEESANAIVVALHDAEIGARKEMSDGDEGLFRVIVPADDVGDALTTLRSEGLPRREQTGFEEVFGEGGLVPTATEERARYVSALGGELARSIESIEGVLESRVHIALPDTRRVSLDDTPPSARASVLMKYRGESQPVTDDALKALIVGAVQSMATEDVSVVAVRVQPRTTTSGSRLVSVGPFSVSRGSATGLKLALGGLLLLNVLLAAFVVLLRLRRPKALPQPEITQAS